MSEDKSRLKLTRRRLLGGIATTGVAAAGAGAGTMALFRDTESSEDNRIKSGTLDLGYQNSNHFSFTITGKMPGEGDGGTLFDGISTTFRNDGTISADHLELDFDSNVREDNDGDPSEYAAGPESDTDTDSSGADGMAEWIVVEEMEYNPPGESTENWVDKGEAVSGPISDVNGNGHIDLDDLDKLSENGIDDLSPPTADGADANLDMRLSLAEKMPNAYQGDVVLTTVTASLHQENGQDTDIDSDGT